jgi:peroxiredoxin Q/BCP
MSGDSVDALRKFRDKYKLNFPLVGDTEHTTLEAYGVWQERNLYGRKTMGVARTTYLIDPDGKVKRVFPNVKVDGHAKEVLAALRQS